MEAQGTQARLLKEALDKGGELRQEAVVTISGLQPSPHFFPPPQFHPCGISMVGILFCRYHQA